MNDNQDEIYENRLFSTQDEEGNLGNFDNIGGFDKIVNELRNNIEANTNKCDKVTNGLNLELDLILDSTNTNNNDFLPSTSDIGLTGKRRFMLSPNSPFVPHKKSSKMKE